MSFFNRPEIQQPIGYPWPDPNNEEIRRLKIDRDEWKAKAEKYKEDAYGYCCDKLNLMNICGGADPECCNCMTCPMVIKAVDGE